jgi:hypothetical protein
MKRLSPKLVQTASGNLAHWCPGCGALHTLDRRMHTWDGNPEEPTVDQAAIHTFGPYFARPATQKVCAYILAQGRLTYLPQTTHPLRRTTVDLPDLPEFV